MSDNTDTNKSDLLTQVENEINKANREGLKAKLKDLVKKKQEAEKVVAGINLEISKLIDDHEKGLL